MNRIAGGNPPAAMQWPVGAATRELAQQGLLTNLDDLAAAGNWAKNLPPLLLRYITADGHIVTAPVDIHGVNWMFTSTKVFKAVGLEPPKSWDEFFAQAPKIKAAGYIPIAFGANAQQEDWLFMALLAAAVGNDGYLAIVTKHDATVAGSAGAVKAFEVMGKLRQYVDAGSPNRKWNDTLALVETNKAAMMIVGDWAKGDLAAANLKVDVDWGCELAPGTRDGYRHHQFICVPQERQTRTGRREAQARTGVHGSRGADRLHLLQRVYPVASGRQHQVTRSLRAAGAEDYGRRPGAPVAAFPAVIHARCAGTDQ